MESVLDKIIHKWLRQPYRLYVRNDIRPKKYRATVILIHGIGNTGELWSDVIARLPNDVRIIALDLLGFGRSPKPSWAVYDARTQSRAVATTLRRLRLKKPVILVGYSMGALVSVELITRQSINPAHVLLLSPPFYKRPETKKSLIPNEEKILTDIYRAIQKRPEQFVKISRVAAKYGLVDKAYVIGNDDVETYMGALEASIINQSAYHDAEKITCPTTIIHGRLDPVVVYRNLKSLVKSKDNFKLKTILANHAVTGKIYRDTIVSEIISQLPSDSDTTSL